MGNYEQTRNLGRVKASVPIDCAAAGVDQVASAPEQAKESPSSLSNLKPFYKIKCIAICISKKFLRILTVQCEMGALDLPPVVPQSRTREKQRVK